MSINAQPVIVPSRSWMNEVVYAGRRRVIQPSFFPLDSAPHYGVYKLVTPNSISTLAVTNMAQVGDRSVFQ